MGIGGSVIFSICKGQGGQKREKENEYFTVSVIGSVLASLIVWLSILLLEKPILVFFGADDNLLSLAQSYLAPVKATVPFFFAESDAGSVF